MQLVGREVHRRALDDVLSTVRSGRSRALVLTGEAGIGKTALLEYAQEQASALRVCKITGVESEMEFTFAALPTLCTALRAEIDDIPPPQRDALLAAIGERAGPRPDAMLVGLAVLSLVSEAARARPVMLFVDDLHWLDTASRRILSFAARRLDAEPVGAVFATRVIDDDLDGIARLVVGPLHDDESAVLLARSLTGPLDSAIRHRIIAEAHGNPLALLQLPRSLRPSELAGGFGAPDAPAVHSLDGVLRRQLLDLPLSARRLLALAAADPAGDASLTWRAAEVLGIDGSAALPALETGLIEIGHRIVFRHPLIRSSAYRCVPLSDRQRIHGALAAVMDEGVDSDRRAWHLGHATVEPDDAVAEQLERSGERVRGRGGVTAAAAFLERATILTADPSRRCDRALAAAEAKAEVGVLDAARDLLSVVDVSACTEMQRARADLVRAQLSFIGRHGNDAAPLLLAAARRLESIDATLARETYLDAMSAALFAGRLAGEANLLDVCSAARLAPRGPDMTGPEHDLLDGLAEQYLGMHAGSAKLRRAIEAYGTGMPVDRELRWMLLACLASSRLWDLEQHARLSVRYLEQVRATGALSHLPLAYSCRFVPLLFTGEFDKAAQITEEMRAVIDASGQHLSPYSSIVLEAWRGRRDELTALCDAARSDAEGRGEGHGLSVIAWATATLANARGDYRTAYACAEDAASCRGDGAASWWALPELVEAASRLGDLHAARRAAEQLAETTTPSKTDWGLGIEARSRALVSEGPTAEQNYQEAVARLGAGGLRPDLARAHLVYGEWLRRRRRRVDARRHLRSALGLFEQIGMSAFADRTRIELAATGETVRPRIAAPTDVTLTAREAQIARLARKGLSNPDIGARLFISSRTVQYHLGKVFTKLGIKSRSQLEWALTRIDTR